MVGKYVNLTFIKILLPENFVPIVEEVKIMIEMKSK